LRADFLAVIFIFFLIVKASGEVRFGRFSAGFRGRKQQRLSQSCVWIYVQDSGGVGAAD
jgi:hypothetical protein